MKKIKKLKLTEMSKNGLEERKMDALRGGDDCYVLSGGGSYCYYSMSGSGDNYLGGTWCYNYDCHDINCNCGILDPSQNNSLGVIRDA
ncbi:MAG: TIGR04149 family rSAM-modified RiPP [Tannerella sp.]|nr:TIGR04149 family rSAM-modified RiPP [Tannerella sp.]